MRAERHAPPPARPGRAAVRLRNYVLSETCEIRQMGSTGRTHGGWLASDQLSREKLEKAETLADEQSTRRKGDLIVNIAGPIYTFENGIAKWREMDKSKQNNDQNYSDSEEVRMYIRHASCALQGAQTDHWACADARGGFHFRHAHLAVATGERAHHPGQWPASSWQIVIDDHLSISDPEISLFDYHLWRVLRDGRYSFFQRCQK